MHTGFWPESQDHTLFFLAAYNLTQCRYPVTDSSHSLNFTAVCSEHFINVSTMPTVHWGTVSVCPGAIDLCAPQFPVSCGIAFIRFATVCGLPIFILPLPASSIRPHYFPPTQKCRHDNSCTTVISVCVHSSYRTVIGIYCTSRLFFFVTRKKS